MFCIQNSGNNKILLWGQVHQAQNTDHPTGRTCFQNIISNRWEKLRVMLLKASIVDDWRYHTTDPQQTYLEDISSNLANAWDCSLKRSTSKTKAVFQPSPTPYHTTLGYSWRETSHMLWNFAVFVFFSRQMNIPVLTLLCKSLLIKETLLSLHFATLHMQHTLNRNISGHIKTECPKLS